MLYIIKVISYKDNEQHKVRIDFILINLLLTPVVEKKQLGNKTKREHKL